MGTFVCKVPQILYSQQLHLITNDHFIQKRLLFHCKLSIISFPRDINLGTNQAFSSTYIALLKGMSKGIDLFLPLSDLKSFLCCPNSGFNNVLILFGIIKFIGKWFEIRSFFSRGQTPNVGQIIKHRYHRLLCIAFLGPETFMAQRFFTPMAARLLLRSMGTQHN